jgi:catechol 2,3-dioxygenase-like lactoylglutathione lyase family enzyme
LSSSAALVKLAWRAAASNAAIERNEGGRSGIAPAHAGLMNFIQSKLEQVPLSLPAAHRQDRPMQIQGYDHVGIRVSDRERALDFYAKLGFAADPEFTTDRVAEIVAADGTRINLIFNGVAQAAAHNVLLDEPLKLPGYTHAAFIVDRLNDILAWAEREKVAVTEGPVDWGRRITCFIRDPDGNVLEFNELKDA